MTTIFSVLFTSIADYNLPRLTSVEFSMARKVGLVGVDSNEYFEVVRVCLLQWRGKNLFFLSGWENVDHWSSWNQPIRFEDFGFRTAEMLEKEKCYYFLEVN